MAVIDEHFPKTADAGTDASGNSGDQNLGDGVEVQSLEIAVLPKPEVFPKERLADTSSSLAAAIAAEGVAAFEQLASDVRADQGGHVFQQLLDNGRPLAEKVEVAHKELAEDMQVEKAILEDLFSKGLLTTDSYTDFKLHLVLEASIPGLPQGEEPSVTAAEIVTLFFAIPDTADIYRRHIPRVGSQETITRQGDLRVYMKRINGKWYWNPFGW
jgi:hypothetical protein